MNRAQIALVAFFAVGWAGCATVSAPKELQDARTANQRASAGVTSQINPSDLNSAKVSLEGAEWAFIADGDTQATRALSYMADRRFQTAESRTRTLEAMQVRDRMHRLAEANEHRAFDAQGRALQSEQQRRMAAEKRAAELARLGAVKQEPRGIVLTLSGGVLFVTNQAELLPSAQVKLNEVAEMLIQQNPKSTIVVEGYTDSQGTATYNQDLSERRAQSVRDYLVSRGMVSDRITSEGFGLTHPVADNGSAEGRANNRRVEIVVQQ